MAAKAPKNQIHGLLVVDKPLGWSSMDVVRRVRRAAGGAKTGHAGTLDPLASGVVVCCLGSATKHVERIMGQPKVYETLVDLSAFTSTDDREGPREEVPPPQPLPDERWVAEVCQRFVGSIQQTPPAHSAVHVQGRRAYEMARKGEHVELQPRTVRIDAIEVLAYEWPTLRLRVDCGKGTYIRSLGRDIGKELGAGGHLAELRRLAVGRYDLSLAVTEQRLAHPIGQEDLLEVPAASGA